MVVPRLDYLLTLPPPQTAKSVWAGPDSSCSSSSTMGAGARWRVRPTATHRIVSVCVRFYIRTTRNACLRIVRDLNVDPSSKQDMGAWYGGVQVDSPATGHVSGVRFFTPYHIVCLLWVSRIYYITRCTSADHAFYYNAFFESCDLLK